MTNLIVYICQLAVFSHHESNDSSKQKARHDRSKYHICFENPCNNLNFGMNDAKNDKHEKPNHENGGNRS